MKREIFKEIEIPKGVEVKVDGNMVTIKSNEGELIKKFGLRKAKIKIDGGKIIVGHKNATKNDKKMINTTEAHLKNMVKGAQEGFEYKLLACSSHFPMTIEAQDNSVIVKNFLGEKIPRKVKMPEGIKIEIGKETDKKIPITIKSFSKEIAGQAAANLEKITKIRMKDRRIFQDGIFIVEKGGHKV